MSFPSVRMRRLRRTPALRALTTTVRIDPNNLGLHLNQSPVDTILPGGK